MSTATRLFDGPNALFQRHVFNDYLRKWVFLAVLIGMVAGLAAIVFSLAIDAATYVFLHEAAIHEPPLTAGEGEGITQVTDIGRKWALPLLVGAGGLISGLLVFKLAPEAQGGGADAAIDAFHQKGGRIRSRVPFVKLVASAVTIGSGGSAGREGPTAQITAGFGSWLADIFHLSAIDRRTALAVGLGAGVGAIFKAPLGGAILAVEILYIRDFELDALVPAFIASVVGYSIFGAYSGWDPLFGEGLGLTFRDPETLGGFALLGLACGLAGIAFVKVFDLFQQVFVRLPMPPFIRTGLAGVLVGCIGLFYPEVLSTGYGWLQLAIEGDTESLAISTMLILIALKIVATSLTVGSGSSGGVFAPGLFIGGMVGGGLYGLLDGLPLMPDSPAPFVIVGMAALIGGVGKTPIAVILMVAEMTNEFSMVIPAMIAVTIAYVVTQNASIYMSQVMTKADSPAHRSEYVVAVTQVLSVADAMRTTVITATPNDSIADAEERMAQSQVRSLPVVEHGRLVGMFTVSDALRARNEGLARVGQIMTTELHVAYPADSVQVALRRITEARISRLPVVRREDEQDLLGMISIHDIARGLDSQLAVLGSTPSTPTGSEGFDHFASLPVQEAMSTSFTTYRQDTPARIVVQDLRESGSYVALVVDEKGYLVGIVTLRDLSLALEGAFDQPVSEVMTSPVLVARELQSLAEALAQPAAEGLGQLPVVTGRPGALVPVGILRRGDVVAALLRARDRQATISRRLLARSGLNHDDLTTVEVSVHRGEWLVGKTLAQLNLPQDAIVTSLIREGRPMIPRGRLVINEGDQLQITTIVALRDLVLERIATEVVEVEPQPAG